jgi:hypothetical protein
MQGWIKIHRKFQNWEWRDSPKHVAVFLDLLLEANHKDKKYRGMTIKAGSLTTSYSKISERTGVSYKSVRTVLKDLISTQEVAYKNCKQYSMISIVNWESYQLEGAESGTQRALKGHSKGTQRATNKNDNNEKNDKNVYKAAYTPHQLIDYWNEKMTPKFAHCKDIGSGSYLRSLLETMKYLQKLSDWDEIFDKVKSTKKFNGDNDLNWQANLIWLCDYDNVLKVINHKQKTNKDNYNIIFGGEDE